jgi:osmotically-inducible protein OsmY
MKTLSVWTGAFAIAALAAGCNGPASETAREGSGVVGQATDAAQDAGNAVGDAVLNGGRAADAAVETLDVKTALVADSRIDAGDINVDTDHVAKTVTLKGKVPTAAQRTFAEEVAVKKAIGYRVENQLTISS